MVMQLPVVWKCFLMVYGELFVMTYGIFKMHRLFVASWDSQGPFQLPGMQHLVKDLIQLTWMM
ncbi:hypothetical protein HOLleu_22394 [Holothuria leucospilota]|uniref:Uncharacterized protein n=1 Tax=Holothuria leucospilota TaxID=206669 RepID=A0A9Q1H747_HOLLE|nr:hypothetical protein HOLleu_22394 [Holothuria leucospilota]